jgi:RNA polymerase sigma-70 factor (ECF subfamily)
MTSMNPRQLLRLYEAHKERLFLIALSVIGDRHDAEEIIHTVFCRMLTRAALPDEPERYLMRAVRNEAYNEYKRKNRRKRTVPLQENIFLVERGAREREWSVAELDSALSSISPEEREVIMMHIYGKCTFQRIADLLDCPISTVSSRYQRALEKLKRILERVDDET